MPVALVTGSARGIGRAVAIRLARDGFDVAINDVETRGSLLQLLAEELRKENRHATTVLADVSSEVEVKNMVEKTVKDLGSLDVVRPLSSISIPSNQLVF
jgi:NAD(P)-dependent dehydrogenase (short-subunit alcohol dehydrogenase family)